MIATIKSRDGNGDRVVFAQGSYQFGLLDARTAGTARLVINASASGMDPDVVKAGSLVHIHPQHGFDHWLGLISADPVYQPQTMTYQIQATELPGFLGGIASIAQFEPPGGSSSTLGGR